MELRLKGERAVLIARGDAASRGEASQSGTSRSGVSRDTQVREVDPRDIALNADLIRALQDWARVTSAFLRISNGNPRRRETGIVVSRRGAQLAGRIARVMGRPVRYRDPVMATTVLVTPPSGETSGGLADKPQHVMLSRLLGTTVPDARSTPWATGLVVAGFIAVVMAMTMFVLAGTLRVQTNDLVVFAALSLVNAGLAPSLWLARRLPVVRWLSLGMVVGGGLSWLGALLALLLPPL
jgi:hypothetical protein